MITVTYGLITYFDKVTAKCVDNLITSENKISFAVKKDVYKEGLTLELSKITCNAEIKTIKQ